MVDRASHRLLLMLGFLAWPVLSSLHAQPVDAPSPPLPPSVDLRFKIDPETPLKDLLPTPPKVKKIAGPMLRDDLTHVPEVQFETPQGLVSKEAEKQIAHQIAKINHLDDKKTDGFIKALRGERPDLHGLPFAMGDACRTKGERSRQFWHAVANVQHALDPRPSVVNLRVSRTEAESRSSPDNLSSDSGSSAPPSSPITFTDEPAPHVVHRPSARGFWKLYPILCIKEDRAQRGMPQEQREIIILARIAALMQILAPMSDMHPGLVQYLSAVSHVEATRALARLAIFSAEEEVRRTAIDALKVRRERDYTDILTKGLRYPWPAVARRAADAVAKLERTDLLAQLVELLEAPDPRAPMMREIKEKRVPMVRELVRVNHHRNCLLCHAPVNTGTPHTLTAAVPVPGEDLSASSNGYNSLNSEIKVRIDVTYLRQDFSALQPVADANPWPEMQRFDFLVRERTLTEEEATAYREKLTPREPGEFSPYQRAALAALRDLTGRDTVPTPEAWRRLLKLPAETPRMTKRR